MNSKKLNFNWQSFVLGIVLCAVLVVFIGSKAADPQSGSMQRSLQRQVNLMDIWEKTSALDARVIAMDERLVSMDGRISHIQQIVDETLKELLRMKRTLDKIANK